MGRREYIYMRDVVNSDRFTKLSGGRVRPKEKVYDRCQLSCGHEGEKIRSKHQNKPPVRMSCEQCKQVDLALQP